jgi:nucleoside-diphosphate-sugar epimerase
MKVLITGAAGFLGQRLARALVNRRTLTTSAGRVESIDEILMLDARPAPVPEPAAVFPSVVAAAPAGEPAGAARPRARVMVGDVADPAVLDASIDAATTSIFHLAAIVSGGAEADFDRGMRVNLEATHTLLEICRARGQRPTVVFTSSVAVYGGDLPACPGDGTALTPQSSYGTQKAIGELLINDYSRRGFVDGRALRLPTISVRPGPPNAAVSSFASGMIREPLNGEVGICPVSPDTRLWLLSPAKVIEALILGHEIRAERLGTNRSLIVPGITVTTGEMVAALERVAGATVASRVRWTRDPTVERVAGTWPGALDDSRARQLGFTADATFDDIVRQFMDGR